jgi:hypothetical protein
LLQHVKLDLHEFEFVDDAVCRENGARCQRRG